MDVITLLPSTIHRWRKEAPSFDKFYNYIYEIYNKNQIMGPICPMYLWVMLEKSAIMLRRAVMREDSISEGVQWITLMYIKVSSPAQNRLNFTLSIL